MYRLIFLFLSTFIFNVSSAQDTIYVNINAAPHGDGSSWGKAFQSLWVACQVSKKKDMIWVAEGDYTMVLPEFIGRSAFFMIKDSVEILGGFSGIELTIDERNILEHPTILTGEIGDSTSTDNVTSVLRSENDILIHRLTLDGLIVTNGYAYPNGSEIVQNEIYGGGLYLKIDEEVGGEIVINNCIFKNNVAQYDGSDIYIAGQKKVKITISNCQFLNEKDENSYASAVNVIGEEINVSNSVFQDEFVGLNISADSIVIEDCLFTGNSFSGLTSDANNLTMNNSIFIANYAGLIAYRRVLTSINLNIQNCKFIENLVGVDLSYIYNGEGALDITNSIFEQNDFGIAHHNLSDLLYAYEMDLNDKEPFSIGIPVTINNSLFYNNTNRSVALYNRSSVINNCVFYNNRSQENGTVVNYYDTLSVYNSIFYNNSTLIGSKNIYSAHSIVKNCLFDDENCDDLLGLNFTLDFHYDDDLSYFDTIYQTSLACQNNIFQSNPEFKDPENNDFNLKICSPAINTGYNPIIDSLGLLYDYQGNPRIQGEAVDMGIYEYEYNEIAFDTIVQHIDKDNYKGSISIENIKQGNAPYSFVWEDGSINAYRDTLDVGTYTVSISDADGCEFVYEFEISDLTSTTNLLADLGINIYPNPVQFGQKLNLNYNAQPASAIISIFDFTGRLVSEEQYNLFNRQNLLDAPKGRGVYLLKIEFNDGRFGFEKLIVE